MLQKTLNKILQEPAWTFVSFWNLKSLILFYLLSFFLICCTTGFHSLSLAFICYHSLSLIATRCHLLSLVVLLVVTRCFSLYIIRCHLLSFIVTLCTNRCHLLSCYKRSLLHMLNNASLKCSHLCNSSCIPLLFSIFRSTFSFSFSEDVKHIKFIL